MPTDIAVKLDRKLGTDPNGGIYTCDICGERFGIYQDPIFPDVEQPPRQADFLSAVLANDHKHDQAHQRVVYLPRTPYI